MSGPVPARPTVSAGGAVPAPPRCRALWGPQRPRPSRHPRFADCPIAAFWDYLNPGPAPARRSWGFLARRIRATQRRISLQGLSGPQAPRSLDSPESSCPSLRNSFRRPDRISGIRPDRISGTRRPLGPRPRARAGASDRSRARDGISALSPVPRTAVRAHLCSGHGRRNGAADLASGAEPTSGTS